MIERHSKHGAEANGLILFLHSSGLSSQQWGRIIRTLTPGARVLAHDFLGCGAKPAWPPDQPFELQTELDGVLDALAPLEAAHVVGHSYGAFVALQLARLYPSRVLSLGLYEPTAFGVLDSQQDDDALESFLQLVPLFSHAHVPVRLAPQRVLTGAIDAPVNEPKIPIGSAEWLRAFTAYWAGEGMWNMMPESTRASFLRAGHKIYLEMRLTVCDETPAAAYAAIEAPTLLMCGARSPAPVRRVVQRLAAAMPRARLQEFADTGHLGPITHATRVNAAIEDHLRNAVAARS